MKFKLRTVTLNCWGIPGCIPTLSSPQRKQRFAAIGKFLQGAQYDVVFLQEVWTQSDFDHVVDQVQDVLPFSFYYKTGVIGSGTCIFSKYEMQDVASTTFTLNGYIHQVWLGDGLAGSGLGLARLSINGLDIIVGVSHFHAEYNRSNDAFLADRCCQALEVLNVLKLMAPRDLILFCGDFNTEPGDLPHRILTQFLTDSWQGTYQKTWGNKRNSYTPSEFALGTQPATLDYVLYRGGQDVDVGVEQVVLATGERIPGGQVSYSDHEALQVILRVEKEEKQEKHEMRREKEANVDDLKEELAEVIQAEVSNSYLWQVMYGLMGVMFFVCGLLSVHPWLSLMAGGAVSFCFWMCCVTMQRRRKAFNNIQGQMNLFKYK